MARKTCTRLWRGIHGAMMSAQVSAALLEAAMMSSWSPAERLRTRSRSPSAKTVPMLVGILVSALRSVDEGIGVSTPATDDGAHSLVHTREGGEAQRD